MKREKSRVEKIQKSAREEKASRIGKFRFLATEWFDPREIFPRSEDRENYAEREIRGWDWTCF